MKTTQLHPTIGLSMLPVLVIALAKSGLPFLTAGLLAATISIIVSHICERWLNRANGG